MENSINKAAFALLGYQFTKVFLELSSLRTDSRFDVSIRPKGLYDSVKGVFSLNFIFVATVGKQKVISVECNAGYKFNQPMPFSDIPNYFYANSIAIIFPYIRAFVSTVTLQANVKPIIIPTLNLSGLSDELRNNTVNE